MTNQTTTEKVRGNPGLTSTVLALITEHGGWQGVIDYIEKLEIDLADSMKQVAELQEIESTLENSAQAMSELKRERDEYKQDAERYRWLRDPCTDVAKVIDKYTHWVQPEEGFPGVGGYWAMEYRAGDELDAAIDAARGAGNG